MYTTESWRTARSGRKWLASSSSRRRRRTLQRATTAEQTRDLRPLRSSICPDCTIPRPPPAKSNKENSCPAAAVYAGRKLQLIKTPALYRLRPFKGQLSPEEDVCNKTFLRAWCVYLCVCPFARARARWTAVEAVTDSDAWKRACFSFLSFVLWNSASLWKRAIIGVSYFLHCL